MLETRSMSFTEMVSMYIEATNTLESIQISIEEAWEEGDKSLAKSLECGSDQHFDIMFEIEEEIEAIFNHRKD